MSDDPNLSDDGTETGANARAIAAKDPGPSAQASQDQSSPPDKQPEVRRAELATPADKAHQEYEDALSMYQRFTKDAVAAEQARSKNKQWVDMKMQELLSQPNQQLPSFEQLYGQQQSLPDQQQLQKQYGMSVLAYAAIAIPLMFAFRRGSAGQAGAMRGFAEALNGIRDSYDQRAHQGIALWKAQNDQRRQLGAERMNYYRETIANQKLDRSEKMDLLKHIADYYGDDATAKHAEAEDYKSLVDHLEKQERLLRQQEQHQKQHEGKLFEFAKSKDQQEYISRLMQRFPELRKGLQSPEGSDAWWKAYDEGMKRYPFAEFQQEVETERAESYKTIHPPKAEKSKPSDNNPLHLNLGPTPAETPQGGATEDY